MTKAEELLVSLNELVIKCSWCGKDMGTKEPLDDRSITHGICPECLKVIGKEIDIFHSKGKGV